MASSENWCHKHSRPVFECKKVECSVNRGNLEYAFSDIPTPGPIDSASIEFKTIFDSLVQQGFTEAQAIYMVAAQVTGNPGVAPGSESPTPPEVHMHICSHGALLCAPCGFIPDSWKP